MEYKFFNAEKEKTLAARIRREEEYHFFLTLDPSDNSSHVEASEERLRVLYELYNQSVIENEL